MLHRLNFSKKKQKKNNEITQRAIGSVPRDALQSQMSRRYKEEYWMFNVEVMHPSHDS